MKLNKKMAVLLQENNVQATSIEDGLLKNVEIIELVNVDGSVLLKKEYEGSKHIKLSDFPDRTGFECFINHVHIPFSGTRESLISCLSYAFELCHKLLNQGQKCQVIASIAEGDCTIRFHQCRSNEKWISDDLDAYTSEAILLLDVTPNQKPRTGELNRV